MCAQFCRQPCLVLLITVAARRKMSAAPADADRELSRQVSRLVEPIERRPRRPARRGRKANCWNWPATRPPQSDRFSQLLPEDQ